MDCQAISRILDERAERRLSAAERCSVDRHLAACDSCAAAWHAHEAMAALRLPATPPHLLEQTLNFVSARSSAGSRRRIASLLMLGGIASAAAVAIAAVAAVKLPKDSGADLEPVKQPRAMVYPSRDRADPPGGIVAPVEPRAAPERASRPIVRIPPEYPQRALQRGLEGWVRVEFTITSTGGVANAHAVASNNSLFEAPAVAAVTRWRFAPRRIDGTSVDVPGVKTTVVFRLGK